MGGLDRSESPKGTFRWYLSGEPKAVSFRVYKYESLPGGHFYWEGWDPTTTPTQHSSYLPETFSSSMSILASSSRRNMLSSVHSRKKIHTSYIPLCCLLSNRILIMACKTIPYNNWIEFHPLKSNNQGFLAPTHHRKKSCGKSTNT